ncbi:MAG TPA: bifunctional oligoribonuclease/PAP phosphatase NrnA [Chitinophagales bacterium]|jgi:phosphoesterase RecJ-like protein|nr:bifunctional oligoribonuclease/PAP phosphatase NrnA [Chitinophagales bacterium]MBP6155239.1 bifunctional oligoribonuclease/PAP phosphatase NrnA [Chitinophagales bacterium]HQV77506.1 bifunctional oligoribonuclease/PAP phosphatase NrnA [Chitinophagales bacterium]HQW78568.1 bifunctional oligoribonuclease/PAP phosphatase NrnA [Chitinophagales bacterium]HRB66715.1 bifunctional oligoribonuclease/PAP phosphatase NrnA [Chitinophagales bacterium]
MEKINELQEFLKTPKNIVITTHQKPDGDAMGSSLALYNYLQSFGHNIRVISPTEYPTYFSYLPSYDEVWNYLENPSLSQIAIEAADLIFCLDFNDLKRIEPLNEFILKNTTTKLILLDHHLYPAIKADWMLHDVKASSTCELVFRFLEFFDADYKITKEVAECIYTGLLTDTASFSNGATNKKSLEIAAHLLDCGLNIIYVQEQLNQNGREEKLRFLGNTLFRNMTIREDIGIGYIVVDKRDAYRFNLQTGDTEGLVNYPLSIKNVKVAILIKQEPKIIKLSFRSKGDFSVEKICREHFEGGGHRNASGGRSFLSIQETIDKIISIFEKENLIC